MIYAHAENVDRCADMASKVRTVWRKCVQGVLITAEQETATVQSKRRRKCIPFNRNPDNIQLRKHAMRTVRWKYDRKRRTSDRKEAMISTGTGQPRRLAKLLAALASSL